MSELSEKIYRKSPILFQNVLISLYGYHLHKQRYGKHFSEFLERLKESEKWNRIDMEKYQLEELKRLIFHCYENVPYYKKLFDSIKLKPSHIQSKSDLKKIPILEKDVLRDRAEELISTNIRQQGKPVVWSTGGTTGKALKIHLTSKIIQHYFAFFERFRNGAGVRVGQKRITVSGRIIVEPDVKAGNLKRYNLAEKQLLLSGYHLSEDNLDNYVEWIRDYDPVYIDGYPAALFAIADHIVKKNIAPVKVKCIYTYAEKLYPYQREVLERAFACKVFNQYGASEVSHFAGECSHGTTHINPEFGILELLNNEGEDSDSGDVVCTSFINYSMPLIRYRIGDMASRSSMKCTCGWDTENLKDIDGRNDERLILEDGTIITSASLSLVFLNTPGIKQTQIIQDKKDSLVLRIVKEQNYSDNDAKVMISELQKRIGTKTTISIESVDEIPLTQSGKRRFIISHVKTI